MAKLEGNDQSVVERAVKDILEKRVADQKAEADRLKSLGCQGVTPLLAWNDFDEFDVRAGTAIATVSIGGCVVDVYCATYDDIAQVAKVIGKNPQAGIDLSAEPPEKIRDVLAIMFSQCGDRPQQPVALGALNQATFRCHGHILEAARAFLWVGRLTPEPKPSPGLTVTDALTETPVVDPSTQSTP